MNNLIQRTTELAMHIISSYVRPGDIVIDATCGNGHDTLRLAQMGPAAVFAFDVQPEAIDATRTLLHKEGFPVSAEAGQSISAEAEQLTGIDAPACRPRVVLACLGHERMAEFFRGRTQSECSGAIPADAGPGALLAGPEGFASAIVFNLGYLPKNIKNGDQNDASSWLLIPVWQIRGYDTYLDPVLDGTLSVLSEEDRIQYDPDMICSIYINAITGEIEPTVSF